MLPSILIVVIAGYVLGSLPFGYLVARAHGVDIFKAGSGSSGATNVKRTVGSGAAALVLFLDALKGAAATAVPHLLRMGQGAWSSVSESSFLYLEAAGLLSAVFGHSFSCFTKFRGGKGVATGAGGFAVLFPVGALLALTTWGIFLAVTRFVSLASMVAAASLPVTAYFRREPPVILWVCLAVAVLVVYRHRANIGRIAAGTEPRIGKSRTPSR